MSSDGNNSKNIAPFTMFSSSADGGYLTELHTYFTGGVEINNLHTDTYGDFRHPPAQGTYTSKFTGGNTHRHQPVGSSSRTEAFTIGFESPQSYLFESTSNEITPIDGAPADTDLMFELDGGGNIQPLDPPASNDSIWELDGNGDIQNVLPNGSGILTISKPTRPALYRDEFARRPISIRNIRQQSPGNFAHTREILHTSGRTLNPGQARAAAYSVTYPLFPSNENAVLNTDGDTANLADYAMPELSSSASAHVFVNRFSSPGDRYTMSRGFLNPIGEEFSAYNAMPFRNLNVREENSDNLTTHNEQFSASFHPVNRNIGYNSTLAGFSEEFFVSDGITISGSTATSPSGTSWDKEIYSLEGSSVFAKATAGITGVSAILFGLDNDPSASPSWPGIDYGWYLTTANNDPKIYENGVLVENFAGARNPGDVFSVVYDGTHVRYFINDQLKRITAVIGSPKLYFDSSFQTGLSEMTDISFTYLKAQYDNANITHAIPQNTLQYAWIGDSAITTKGDFQGFATGSDISFYSGTIGFDSPMNNVFLDEDNNKQDFDFTGSVYGYNTWKQIRGGELKLSRHYRENSILAAANNKDIVTQFSEPAIVAKHKPMEHIIGIDESSEDYTVKSPYGNELVRHSNDDINKLFAFTRSDDDTSYPQLKDNYINRSIDDPANPIKRFVSMTYGETVFPRSSNAFTKKIKIRGNYTEIAGTGNRGYDRTYGTQNTFFHTTNKRTSGAKNSQGYTTNSYSAETYNELWSAGTDWGNHSAKWLRDETSGVLLDAPTGSHAFVLGGQQDKFVPERYLMYLQPLVGAFTASFDYIGGIYSPLGMNATASYGLNTFFLQARSAEQDWQRVGDTVFVSAGSTGDGAWATASFSASFATPHQVRIASYTGIGFTAYDNNNFGFKNIEINGTPASTEEQLSFSPMGTSGTGSFRLSASYDKNVGELNFDTDRTTYQKDTIPSLSFSEETYIVYNNTSSFYTERLVEEMAQKNPSYDSQELYNDDLHHLAKETSIVPEFRISENMEYYISDAGGNFRQKNKKFLSLLGSENSSSAGTRSATSFDSSFEAAHLTTDTIENLSKIKYDHIGHSKPRKLTLTAKGIKKLLPYGGFYPDARTVQLGNLLSSSFSDSISSYKWDSSSETTSSAEAAKGWAGFLKPIQSPGILYNTIKAGVGVGYPIYSAPVTAAADYQDNFLGDNQLTRAPDYRLPFETLVNFNQNMPKDSNVFYVSEGSKEEGSEEEFPYYFNWSGKNLPYYELATHNFLAESVNFFLEKGQVNSFISSPEKEFLEVEADKNYYMDVVLRDANDHNKFVNVKGTKEAFPNFEPVSDLRTDNTDEHNGWDVAVVDDGNGGYYSVSSTPGFADSPTNGFVQMSYVDSAGNKEDLDPTKSILTGSSSTGAYGYSVAITSGSGGVYVAVGETGSLETHLYNYSGGTLSYIDSSTPSGYTGALNDYPIKAEIHSSSYGVVVSAVGRHNTHGTLVGVSRCTGSVLNFVDHAISANMKRTLSTAVNGYSHELGMSMISSSADGHTIGVSSQLYNVGGNFGAAAFYSFDGLALAQVGGSGSLLLNPTNPATKGFGSDISMDYAPDGSGLVVFAVGCGTDEPQATAGYFGNRVDVFLQSPSNLHNGIHMSSLTSSASDLFDSYGTAVGLQVAGPVQPLSGTSGIYNVYVAASQPWHTEPYAGGIHFAGLTKLSKLYYTSFGALSSINEKPQDLLTFSSDFDDLAQSPRFGMSLDMSIQDTGDDLLLAVGSPYYSGSFSAGGIAHVIYGSSSYHDYKQDGKLFGMPIDNTYDPAYCAYTHPGFYGESVARLAFSSSVGGAVTLEEIFRDARVTEIMNVETGRVRTVTGSAVSLTSLQDSAKMPVASSVTLFGKSVQPDFEFLVSEDGTQSKIDRVSSGGKNKVRWAISTKYECPVLDVSSSDYAANYTTDVITENQIFDLESGSVGYDLPRSVWTSHGNPTPPNKKYTFELRESFSKESYESGVVGSLIDLCGFTPGKKNIGSVAEEKVISEALMVIPYVDLPIRYKTIEMEDDKHFFRVNKVELMRQKKSMEDNGFAVSEDIRETSISQTIDAMKNYIVPPHYDFLKYKDIKPFVAYFLEFEHTLSQRDLIDIWQGVSPAIGLNPETEEVEVSHDFDKHNFFHNVDLPSDIKFMVFKVKKKAEWNYYDITTDSTDDNRFRFDLQGDGKVEVIPDYNYNWPYDFFSLVERAKVDVDITFKKEDEEE